MLSNEKQKKAFAEAVKNNKAEDFLKANDCAASAEELSEFLKEQQSKTGELSGDELNNVAGGCNKDEAILSVVSMGFYCAVGAIASAASDSNTIGEDGRILC